jgi:hypothetical protein
VAAFSFCWPKELAAAYLVIKGGNSLNHAESEKRLLNWGASSKASSLFYV